MVLTVTDMPKWLGPAELFPIFSILFYSFILQKLTIIPLKPLIIPLKPQIIPALFHQYYDTILVLQLWFVIIDVSK